MSRRSPSSEPSGNDPVRLRKSRGLPKISTHSIDVSTEIRQWIRNQQSDEVKNLTKGEWTHVAHSRPRRIDTLKYTTHSSATMTSRTCKRGGQKPNVSCWIPLDRKKGQESIGFSVWANTHRKKRTFNRINTLKSRGTILITQYHV